MSLLCIRITRKTKLECKFLKESISTLRRLTVTVQLKYITKKLPYDVNVSFKDPNYWKIQHEYKSLKQNASILIHLIVAVQLKYIKKYTLLSKIIINQLRLISRYF